VRGERSTMNATNMKKNHTPEPAPDAMRPHYDFDYSKSRPNRFAARPKLGRVTTEDRETPQPRDPETPHFVGS